MRCRFRPFRPGACSRMSCTMRESVTLSYSSQLQESVHAIAKELNIDELTMQSQSYHINAGSRSQYAFSGNVRASYSVPSEEQAKKLFRAMVERDIDAGLSVNKHGGGNCAR